MSYVKLIILILSIIILWAVLERSTSEQFNPDRADMAKQILQNKDLFSDMTQLVRAKQRMPLIDPVTYYDAVRLYGRSGGNRFTADRIAAAI